MPITPVHSPSATEYLDIDTQIIDMTTDVDKIKKGKLNEEAFYKVDDGRFDDW